MALLEVRDLAKSFGGQRRFLAKPTPVLHAVDGVSLDANAQEAVGIVGESGCGKSTLAKTILGLLRETAGSIVLDRETVSGLSPSAARRARRAIQYVHQDPGAALDPWWRVGSTLHETLKIHGVPNWHERNARLEAVLSAVGLEPGMMARYPHELSGGQQRRIGLARTLSLRPEIVILDEPTSGLDLSVQASVLALIARLRAEFALTVIFISHDLSVVRRVADRVAVMYLGKIVELAPTEALFDAPRHPYTNALFSAAPTLQPKARPSLIKGDPPSPTNRPSGCAFRSRCPLAMPVCAERVPPLTAVAPAHEAACFASEAKAAA